MGFHSRIAKWWTYRVVEQTGFRSIYPLGRIDGVKSWPNCNRGGPGSALSVMHSSIYPPVPEVYGTLLIILEIDDRNQCISRGIKDAMSRWIMDEGTVSMRETLAVFTLTRSFCITISARSYFIALTSVIITEGS
jgi:hypothetical protein